MRATRVLVVTLIAIAGLFVLYLQTRGLDREKYSEGVTAIVELQRKQHEFETELVRIRHGAADAKERVTAKIEQIREGATSLSGLAAVSDSAELAAAVREYQASVETAATHAIDATETAGFLIEGARRIAADLAGVGMQESVQMRSRNAVSELVKQILLFDLGASGDRGKDVLDAVHRLKSVAQEEPDAGARAELDKLARHTQTYVDDRIVLDGRLAEVTGFDLQSRTADILKIHEETFESQLRGAEYFRLGLYAFTAALLARLFQNMREIKRRTRELHEANQTLEQRVQDRTRRLSATNTALQIEVVERERAELQVREALTEVEKASRTKSEFLANMSHEIRTPMTSILGFSERLLDARLTDTEKIEAVSTIRRNGDYLLQIINDILDISKIEAGMFSIEKIPCSPKEILAEVHAAMEVRAAIKGIELVVESAGAVPRTIVSDPVRLKQILLNLVGNALKFTEKGSVHLSVALVDGGAPALRFQVRDTGIGMDAETVTRLFRPFMQADSSTTRRFGGTGLGLSISKHLVEQLGGQVAVESESGVGSTFSFTVETGSLEGVELEDGPTLSFLSDLSDSEYLRPPPSLPGVRVLLAEDGEDNRRLLGYVLASAQATTTTAVDGNEALAMAMGAIRTGHPFDVILMDMQMPELDGYEATRRLRAQGCQTPIIALTAHAMAADREKCLAAGCDDFCTKPIVRNTFLTIVAEWAERKKSNWSAPPLPPVKDVGEHASRAAKPDASTTTRHASSNSGKVSPPALQPLPPAPANSHTPKPANPKPATSKPSPYANLGAPIGSLPAPEADAPRPHSSPTPLDRRNEARSLPLHPPAPMSKPGAGSLSMARDGASRNLTGPASAPLPTQPSAPSKSSTTNASNAVPLSTAPLGGGPIDAELLELVNLFVSELGEEVDEMRTALARGDLAQLGVLAHRLKGAAGSYGFPSLTLHASTLEKQAKAGAPKSDLERDIERIADVCAAARAERGL